MNRKHEHESIAAENGEYAVHHSRRRDIIAAVICLVLAVVVWMLVMNVDDTAHVDLAVADGSDAYVYTLSDESLEVTGTVVALKKAKDASIKVIVPDEAVAPGTYQLSLENLVLPEGVALLGLPDLTLTVSPK